MNGIPLSWSDSGPQNVRNAFGEVVSSTHTDEDGVPLPFVCLHGGSGWCCFICAHKALVEKPEWFRTPTDEERKRLRKR